MTELIGNRTWTHFYNPTGQINRTVDPLGGFVFRQYDVNLNPAFVTDQNGHTTLATYDVSSNPRSFQDALGNTVTATYDPTFNVPLTVTDALGNVTLRCDAKGNSRSHRPARQRHAIPATTAAASSSPSSMLSGKSSSLSYDTYGNIITPPIRSAHPEKRATTSSATCKPSDASGRTTQFFI